MARGLPLPVPSGGGLVVEVAWPDQVRRHVFLDAGAALEQCAAQVNEPFVHVKAAVSPEQLRLALPAHWTMEIPRYLMYRSTPMRQAVALPDGYATQLDMEHGAQRIRIMNAGQVVASGGVVVKGRTAIFDRIETLASHRRLGLGTAVMAALDGLAEQAGVTERLLVATETGSKLYESLGWRILAPYSTAIS